jgi:hypothetical protein
MRNPIDTIDKIDGELKRLDNVTWDEIEAANETITYAFSLMEKKEWTIDDTLSLADWVKSRRHLLKG